jgi:hypothetical protein
MIDKELELVKEEWNTHVIRHSRYFDSPPGIPNALYFFPDLKGSHCFKCSVTEEQLCAIERFTSSPPHAVSLEFSALASFIMEHHGMRMPQTVSDGLRLYDTLVHSIERGEIAQ